METIKGTIKAISISQKKGTKKVNVPQAELKEDSGIIREHAVTREVHEEDNKKQETQKWIGALAIIILIAVISVLFSYFAINVKFLPNALGNIDQIDLRKK